MHDRGSGSSLDVGGHVDLDWITDRIAVGAGVFNDAQVRTLEAAGVTHVFDCRRTSDFSHCYRASPIVRIRRGVDDDNQPKDKDWYHEGIIFAFGVLQLPRTKLYVHCTAGWNRSPAMVYAILRALGVRREDVERLLAARPEATGRYYDNAEDAVRALGFISEPR